MISYLAKTMENRYSSRRPPGGEEEGSVREKSTVEKGAKSRNAACWIKIGWRKFLSNN